MPVIKKFPYFPLYDKNEGLLRMFIDFFRSFFWFFSSKKQVFTSKICFFKIYTFKNKKMEIFLKIFEFFGTF